MRVFLWELKKIWRLWILLATAAVLVLGYFLFVENQLVWLDYEEEKGWAEVEYTTAKTWLERYVQHWRRTNGRMRKRIGKRL